MRKIFQTERSVNKIFSLRWYPSSTGLYGVIAKLTADESIKVKKKMLYLHTFGNVRNAFAISPFLG